MWKDTEAVRQKRYRDVLSKCPELNVTSGNCDENRKTEDYVTGSVGSYVLAPAITGFVMWVLKEAVAAGKKRLYFLARDGYLMYRVASYYCEAFKLPVECRYLCCSRYSVRIPMYRFDIPEAMDYICRGGIDVTMKKILDRAGLDEEEEEEVLCEIKTDFSAEEIIPYSKIGEVRKELEKNETFKKYLLKHSKEAFPYLEGYLVQEGLFDDVPYAFVDSGWVGSMQKVLNRMLTIIAKEKEMLLKNRPEGYYWGLYELPEDVEPAEYHCYYFSPGRDLKEKIYFSNCLFEGVFTAPHGMTLKYTGETGDRYSPVFADISGEHKSFTETTEKYVMNYTKMRCETLRKESPDVMNKFEKYINRLDFKSIKRTTYRLLKIFMGNPAKAEAEIYGSMQFSDDVIDRFENQLAAPMTDKELRANHAGHKILSMLGLIHTPLKESAWYEGSAVNNGKHVKRHLRGYAAYKCLLYLRKQYIWRKTYG